jgi:hypothetical protein
MKRTKAIILFSICTALTVLYEACFPAPVSISYFLLYGAGFAVLSLVYAGFGLKLSDLLKIHADGALRYPVAAALSLLAAGTVIFAAGFAGLYNTYFFIGLMAAMVLLSYREILSVLRDVRDNIKGLSGTVYSTAGLFTCTIAAVVFLYMLVTAMLPPVYYDTLVYHLAVPAQYMAAGRAINMPENLYSYFPCLMGMNYMMFSVFAGELGPTLLQLVLAMFTALMVKELAEISGGSGKWALLLLITFPLFMLNAGRVTSEMALAFCTAGMLLVFDRSKEKFSIGGAFAAAAFMAVMLGTKYTGVIIYAFGVLYAGILLMNKKTSAVPVLITAAVPLLLFVPYAIRNFAWANDPVYPFMTSFFDVPFELKSAAAAYTGHVSGFALSHNILNLFYSIVCLVFRPDMFGGDVVSPLLIIGIFAFFTVDMKRFSLMALFFVFYYIVWFYTGEVLRFLLPDFIAIIVITSAAARGTAVRFRNAAFGALVIVQLFTSFYIIERYQMPFKIFEKSRTEYLSRSLSYYGAAEAISALPADDRRAVLFLGEARTLYCNRRVFADTVFNKGHILSGFETLSDAQALEKLKVKNIGYIMINLLELDRLKDGGFEEVSAMASTEKFKNFMDKNFTRIYSVGDLRIFRMN